MTMLTPASRLSRPFPSMLTFAAAAAAAVLAGAPVARAQYQVGAGGHYNDASNRLGSGGYNSGDAGARFSQNAIQNQVSTGNVTGLYGFHGNTGTFDTNTLQVNTQDAAVQQFTQVSAPVNYAQRSTGAPIYNVYYNQAQYSAQQTPTDFTPTRNNVGLLTSAQNVGSLNSPISGNGSLTPGSGTTEQNFNAAQVPSDANLPGFGVSDQPGQVNSAVNTAVNQQSFSALYGAREVQGTDSDNPVEQAYLQRYGATPRTLSDGQLMNPQRVQQFRDELNSSVVPNGADANGAVNGNGAVPSSTLNPNGTNGGTTPNSLTLGQPNGSTSGGAQLPDARVSSSAVANQPVNSNTAVPGTTPLTSQVGGPLSIVRQQLMIAPGQQSQQLADLQKRFAATTPHPTAAQSAEEVRRMEQVVHEQEAQLRNASKSGSSLFSPSPAKGDLGTSSAHGLGADRTGGTTDALRPATPGSAGPGSAAPTLTSPVAKPDMASVVREPAAEANDRPLVISSLAYGIKATGLKSIMLGAEKQMRDGQFAQAVDSYDAAGEVAPNNPFVPLGRGFAELGASYYGKAEADLTRAITTGPYVLAGQYNLKGFLGDTRLKFVQTDLADIAKTEKTARPHLLLAYLAHNTGQSDDTVTAPELDAAAAAGGDMNVISLMRTAWNLKAPAAK